MKTRQDHITDVQVAFPGILSYGGHPFEDLSDDARGHNDTDVIVEEDILLRVLDAAGGAGHRAYGMERP